MSKLSKSIKPTIGQLIAYYHQKRYPHQNITDFIQDGQPDMICTRSVYSRMTHHVPVKSEYYVRLADKLGFSLVYDAQLDEQIKALYSKLLLLFYQDLTAFREKLEDCRRLLASKENDLYFHGHLLLFETLYQISDPHVFYTKEINTLCDISFLFQGDAMLLFHYVLFEYLFHIRYDFKQADFCIQVLGFDKQVVEPIHQLIYARYLVNRYDTLTAYQLCRKVQVFASENGYAHLYDETLLLQAMVDMELDHTAFFARMQSISADLRLLRPSQKVMVYQLYAYTYYLEQQYEQAFAALDRIYHHYPDQLIYVFPYYAYFAKLIHLPNAQLLQITKEIIASHPDEQQRLPYLHYMEAKLTQQNPTRLKHDLLKLCPFYLKGSYHRALIVDVFQSEMEELCQLRNSNQSRFRLERAIQQYCNF